MRNFWTWTVGKFWWLWSLNVLAAFLVIAAFVLGWIHETITAPNIPAWCVILATVMGLLGGSLWLRSIRRVDLGVCLLLLIPLPVFLSFVGSFLLGVLYLLVGLIGSLFGHGRVNRL